MIVVTRTLFDTLGIAPTDDVAEIKHAWRRKLTEVHPDRGGSRKDFDAVQSAWQVLSDDWARSAYIAKLNQPKATSAPEPASPPSPAPAAASFFEDFEPSYWQLFRSSATASVLLSLLFSILGALVALTAITAGVAAVVTSQVIAFSPSAWFMGSAFLAAFWAQVAARVSPKGPPWTWATFTAAFFTELAIAYLGLGWGFAFLLAASLLPSLALLSLPLIFKLPLLRSLRV